MAPRILLWGELFWPYVGGAEIFAARLMSALRPRGYEFSVITSHDHLDLPDEDSFRGIPVHRFGFRRALAERRLDELAELRRRVAEVVDRTAPQLIHLNGVGPNAFFCLQAARSAGVPLLVRLNAQPLRAAANGRAPAGRLLERALESAAWVASVSAAALAQARELMPSIAARSSVVHSGIEVSAAPPAAPPSEPPRILCLGRLVSDKGFDLAIAALPRILERRPEARLVVAGDGPERAALERQAEALGVGARVEFRGWVLPGGVAALIADATILLMPSRTEGLPGVALEAAAHGRPVVASRAGGLPEVVVEGETGRLADLDPTAIAAAVAALLADPALCARMGRAAWRRARERFGHESCVAAYDQLYRRLAR